MLTDVQIAQSAQMKPIKEIASQNVQKAHVLAQTLVEKGWNLYTDAPFFNEFVVELTQPVSTVNQRLLEKGIVGGLDVSDVTGTPHTMLVCVTEKRTAKELDMFVKELEAADK